MYSTYYTNKIIAKNTVIFSFLLFVTTTALYAQSDCINDDSHQPCCNGLISTDPRTGQAVNPERGGTMINKFNWMSSSFNIFLPTANGGFTFNNGPLTMTNPFFSTSEYLQEINYFNFDFADRVPENLDFFPEKGWELIHKNNGYMLDETTYLPTEERRSGPYFILYNRYNGKMRLFAALDDREGNDRVLTTLKFHIPTSNTNNLKPSALLSLNKDYAQPLDQKTVVDRVSQSSDFPNKAFFTAEFPMAYDPCVCNNRSTFHVTFTGIDEMQLHLEGRSLGTSVHLTDDGHDGLLNGRDFMSSVFHDPNFSVNGGSLTYSNIDALVAEWKAPPQLNIIQKLGIDAFKAVLGAGASAIDAFSGGVLSSVAEDLLTPSYKQITGDTNKLKVPIGLSVAANFSKTLITSLFPDRPTIPDISFIESEIALTGTATDPDPLHNQDIEFAVPGSKDTHDESVVATRYYPSYNEALGVFALLKTPIISKKRLSRWVYHQYGVEYVYDGRLFWDDYRLKEDIKYYFNPAAEIDEVKTSIHAGIVVISDCMKKLTPEGDPTLWNGWTKVDETNDNLHRPIYQTSCFPVGCLKKGMFRITNQGVDYGLAYQGTSIPQCTEEVYLKVILQIVHKPNKYGKINKTLLIFTYPVTVETEENELEDAFYPEAPDVNHELGQVPYNIEITSDTYYPTSTIVEAWNTIAIKANITVAQGATVTFRAGRGVTVLDASLFDNDKVKIEIGSPDICSTPLPPQTPADVKVFCGSSSYKASQFQTLTQNDPQTGANLPPSRSRGDSTCYENYLGIARPNPASDYFTIPYSMEVQGRIEMTLFNSLGEKIGTIVENSNHPKGHFEVRVYASLFPAGIYFYTMQVGSFIGVEKIAIIH